MVYIAVKKGNIVDHFFYFRKYSSQIIITYKSSCALAYQTFCGLSDSRYSASYAKNVIIFS